MSIASRLGKGRDLCWRNVGMHGHRLAQTIVTSMCTYHLDIGEKRGEEEKKEGTRGGKEGKKKKFGANGGHSAGALASATISDKQFGQCTSYRYLMREHLATCCCTALLFIPNI